MLHVRGISESGLGESVCSHESGIHVVKHVGPNLTDIVDLVEASDGGVTERVGRVGRGVGVGSDASGIITEDVRAKGEVRNGLILVFGPSVHQSCQGTSLTKGVGRRTYSAKASDQPSPIPPLSVVCRQRPEPPPVSRFVIP